MITCRTCRANALGEIPIECERHDCPGHLAREERAYERGEHVEKAEAAEERRARLREWDIALGHWMPALAAVFLLAAALPVHATLPTDSVVIFLKTAKVTLKAQYRDSTGALKEKLVGSYASAREAKEAMRLMPALKGGLLYRIDVPPAYANVIECVVPQGSICVDAIDHRLFIQ